MDATLKTFQQKLGKHFARSEASLAAFNYIQALLSPVERVKTVGKWLNKWDTVLPIGCSIY